MRNKLLLLTLLLVLQNLASAHSGRTDGSGGHNCSAKSKAKGLCSGYHYHSGGNHRTEPANPKPIQKNQNAPIVGPFSTLYDRSEWPHWIDEDRDCQNTRVELLIARSKLQVKFRNVHQCSVIQGQWHDPYSNQYWTKASDVDIDHIVPLAWAHGHGGQDWAKDKKQEFANDWENLLIVEDSLNQSKGAKSPDEWMPPNQKYHCEYVAKFDEIVSKYQLIYVASEKGIVEKMLSNCKHNINI